MYRLTEVVEAADPREGRLATVRSWFARGHLQFTETDQAPPKSGVMGLLGRDSAVRVAATMALADLGIEPEAAGKLAGLFAYVGDAVHFNGEVQVRREPGGLYKDGQTLLGVWRAADGEWHGRVVNAVWTDNWPFILQKLTHGLPAPASPTTMAILDCGEVLKRLQPLFNEDIFARRARIIARAEAAERRAGDKLAAMDREATENPVPPAAPRKRGRPRKTEPVT